MKKENGSFDLDDGEFRFEQVFPDTEDEDGETTWWSATYDPSTDTFIIGEWKDDNEDVTGKHTLSP